MGEGFRFDGAQPSVKATAQKAVDAGRLLFPVHCACGRETFANRKAFLNPEVMIEAMQEDMGWSFVLSYIPKLDHVVIRAVCPDCTAKTKE